MAEAEDVFDDDGTIDGTTYSISAHLRELPLSFKDLPFETLLRLRLQHNLFTPSSFDGVDLSRFCSLTELDLTFNHTLRQFPSPMLKLPSLKKLILCNCHLDRLHPDMPYALTTLEYLSISCNDFGGPISSEISIFNSLKVLKADENQLSSWSEVPPSLQLCSTLQDLSLTSNQFVTFPAEICQLTFLTTIDFAQNKLDSIPSSISFLSSLTSLSLSGNKLTSLPSALVHMPLLSCLYLDDNSLSSLPEAPRPRSASFSPGPPFPSLTELSARRNPLLCIPSYLLARRTGPAPQLNINSSVPDYIVPGVYLGSWDCGENIACLRHLQISHVLIVSKECHPPYPEEFDYETVLIQDDEDVDILEHFPRCIDFIRRGIDDGGVLVHCAAGISRSASVVISYLLAETNMNVDEAIAYVAQRRPCIAPNPGFHMQLQRFCSDQVRSVSVGRLTPSPAVTMETCCAADQSECRISEDFSSAVAPVSSFPLPHPHTPSASSPKSAPISPPLSPKIARSASPSSARFHSSPSKSSRGRTNLAMARDNTSASRSFGVRNPSPSPGSTGIRSKKVTPVSLEISLETCLAVSSPSPSWCGSAAASSNSSAGSHGHLKSARGAGSPRSVGSPSTNRSPSPSPAVSPARSLPGRLRAMVADSCLSPTSAPSPTLSLPPVSSRGKWR
mmetsp:Transcript_45405/g.73990  ORF Transcript_45405/g.73990 Transcript_45405/m.73990 type:complete len:674 (+) Transcript_45405:49-2070(+)|eukprot:CAMPEP_0184343332 /NCGR_PEP_ID=MMETSP1089-20130417/11859_1 /TAXON_ID=38269 ORGANISM="Gloeochaete wittrockiana, Strain SAG46.84" /NCGR_SAMPLE_ID=MMETSP1089 /ASSEMBLY_ACC=CAM_ASM_000445 /LENGTH=673 /DNA_ID=CAMNT_0026672579 /DNA_START=42 /DNA_END=2063 /DNA_ORIENTATION=-